MPSHEHDSLRAYFRVRVDVTVDANKQGKASRSRRSFLRGQQSITLSCLIDCNNRDKRSEQSLPTYATIYIHNYNSAFWSWEGSICRDSCGFCWDPCGGVSSVVFLAAVPRICSSCIRSLTPTLSSPTIGPSIHCKKGYITKTKRRTRLHNFQVGLLIVLAILFSIRNSIRTKESDIWATASNALGNKIQQQWDVSRFLRAMIAISVTWPSGSSNIGTLVCVLHALCGLLLLSARPGDRFKQKKSAVILDLS